MHNSLLGPITKLRQTRLPKSTFARGVAVLAGGTAVGQLVGFAVAPLLSRLYAPSDFGVLAVFMSVTAIWAVVSTLRYEYAIPLAADSDAAANVLGAGATVLVVTCAIGSAVTAALGPAACRTLNAQGLIPYLWLVPLSVLLAGAYQLLYYWALRQRSYRQMASTRLTQALTRAAVQSGLGLIGVAPLGLLLGHVTGAGAGGIALSRVARGTSAGAFSRVRAATLLHAAKRYVRFATYGTMSGLLNAVGLQAATLGFVYVFGATQAGLFGLMQRVLTLPLALVGVAIGETYLGVAPKLLRENPAHLSRLFTALARRLFVVGIVPTAAIVIGGPWLFSAVFGESWYVAGEYARFMAPAALVQLVVSPLSQTANVFERQDLQALADLVRAVLLIGVFAAASLLGWQAETCVALIAAATCASYGLYFALYYGLLRKLPDASRVSRKSDLPNDRVT